MKLHHGCSLSYYKVRNITQESGRKAKQLLLEASKQPHPASLHHSTVIMQADGLMVPIVVFKGSHTDRRKNRKIEWREMKLACLREQNSTDRLYSYSFKDDDALDTQTQARLADIGHNGESAIHGLGDGATWICEFGERVAGTAYHHTIDFFHLCQYLHGACENCVEPEKAFDSLKEAAVLKGIRSVSCLLGAEKRRGNSSDKLNDCIRYIRNRPGQFKYPEARARGLPIGSGEIEGGNRTVIQQRLKQGGCWWTPENADLMGALRVIRANDQFDQLWEAA